jgi:hypothetical protein
VETFFPVKFFPLQSRKQACIVSVIELFLNRLQCNSRSVKSILTYLITSSFSNVFTKQGICFEQPIVLFNSTKKEVKMKRKSAHWLSVVALIVGFTSCSKDPISQLTEEESRIYITNHDSTSNFSSFKTYSISDSVVVNNNGQVNKQLNATDQAFISAVKNQMQVNGFTLVSKSSNPDLGINVNRIYNTSTGVVAYRDYYDYYYGSYWDPYYWGYPGYDYYTPYSYATYSVKEGALSIDLLDLKNAPVKNKIEVIWTGLIRGSGIFDATTASSQVKMLFDQSPYLKTQQ